MKKNLTLLLVTLFLGGFVVYYGCQKKIDNSSKKSGVSADAVTAPSIQVYGVWHAGNDACTWATVRTVPEFDSKNHWLIDRGDGSGKPSVNLVILSFVNPLKLLSNTSDAGTVNGVPKGMTLDIVNYFKSKGIRVMLSIGGITFVKDWNTALAQNATQLGMKAAALATSLGVGIEIDYEENSTPNLNGLQSFISAYRSVHAYDATGNDPTARLTIDLAAGDRWLIGICQKATASWLTSANPVLDYANAMVPARQPRASDAIANWQEHVDGKPQYAPPIPPLAPAKFTGSLWLTSSKSLPECTNFTNSLQKSTGNYVQTVVPNGAGTTPGMLGYMFWAAECEGTRTVCTTPPNSCEGGIGGGAAFYNVPIPMQALRQQ
jgi:hypothetical protein